MNAPAPMIDADLMTRNRLAARGLLDRLDPYDRNRLLDTLGVTYDLTPPDREKWGAETLAYLWTASGQDVVKGASTAGRVMAPDKWARLEAAYRGRPGRGGFNQVPLQGSGKSKKVNPFRAVQNEIGRGLRRAGKEVKRWEKAPIVGKYVVGPLGGAVVGETLVQVGNVFRGGSIRDFNERAWVLSVGHTLSSAGQALIAASPFLPAPWNAVALAAGTASLLVGKVVQGYVKSQEAKEIKDRAEGADPAPDAELEPSSADVGAPPALAFVGTPYPDDLAATEGGEPLEASDYGSY
jgi:hypothetical protein